MRKTKVADSDFTYLLTSQYRGANSKQKLNMSIQGEPQDDLINDLVNLSDMDLSYSLPQDGQLFPKSNNLFLQEKAEADLFKNSRLTIESSSAKKSLPSSVLTNYSAKIIPALKNYWIVLVAEVLLLRIPANKYVAYILLVYICLNFEIVMCHNTCDSR